MTPELEKTLEMPVVSAGGYVHGTPVPPLPPDEHDEVEGPLVLLRFEPGVLARMVGETLAIGLLVVFAFAIAFLVALGCYSITQVTP